MSSSNPKLQLGDSWVVEEEDSEYSPKEEDLEYSPKEEEDSEYSLKEEEEPITRPQTSTPRRSPRGENRSPEPEFVMPSIYVASMDVSRSNSPIKVKSRNIRVTDKAQETRRRARPGTSNGNPEKRSRTNFGLQIPSRRTEPGNFQDIVEVAVEHCTAIMSWLLDVFGGALKVLKTPLSYILAVWLLFGLLVVVRNLVTNSVYASLSPVCRIPGVSLLNLPFCPVYRVDNSNGPPPKVEFDQLMAVQSKFEEVLEDSAGGVSLPLDMKRGEASIRDLRQLVRYSHLHSKNELVLEFDGFIETARIASYDLQKFNSHVGRAVDSVIATTRWTTRVLDGIQERDASRGAVNAFINDRLLAPFQPVKFTETILLDQYIQHTRIVEDEILKLIEEAQAILIVLNNLEDRLDIIHGIATRDDMHAKALKEEVLAELWTMVGGNRGKLNKMDKQLNLLKQVGLYRKSAFAHVSGTIIRLQAISAGLEDLRERVGSPELLRDRIDVPLSVHIENIQKGVERLEESRQNARKLEDEHIRKTLERGRLEGTMIDG